MKSKTIRLVLHSDSRDNQNDTSRDDCVFGIPDITMSSADAAKVEKVELVVERFIVASDFGDAQMSVCLLGDSFNQPSSFDSITGAPCRVIAVNSNPMRFQGSTNTSFDAMYPVELDTAALTNRRLRFRLVQPQIHNENVNASNNQIRLVETIDGTVGTAVSILLPHGDYSIDRGHPSLISAIQTALNSHADTDLTYRVTYSPVTGKVTIACPSASNASVTSASVLFKFDVADTIGKTIGFTVAEHTLTTAVNLVSDDVVDLSLYTQDMTKDVAYEPVNRAWYAVLCFKLHYRSCCDECKKKSNAY